MAGNAAMSSDNWTGFAVNYSTTGFTQSNIASDTILYPPKTLVNAGSWIGYDPYKINIQSADDAYLSVVEKVGTVNRDSVERRIIREVKNGLAIFKASQGKAGIIDNSFNVEGYLPYPTVEPPVDNDHDGMADTWESSHGLNPADAEDRNKVTLSGYTALEVYLNSLMGETIPLEFVSGIDNKNIVWFELHPSVAQEQVTVKSDLQLENGNIFGLNGRLLKSFSLSETNTVNIKELVSGCYLFEVKSSEGFKNVRKLIKL